MIYHPSTSSAAYFSLNPTLIEPKYVQFDSIIKFIATISTNERKLLWFVVCASNKTRYTKSYRINICIPFTSFIQYTRTSFYSCNLLYLFHRLLLRHFRLLLFLKWRKCFRQSATTRHMLLAYVYLSTTDIHTHTDTSSSISLHSRPHYHHTFRQLHNSTFRTRTFTSISQLYLYMSYIWCVLRRSSHSYSI